MNELIGNIHKNNFAETKPIGSIVGKRRVVIVLMFLCLLSISALHITPASAKEETFVEEHTYSKIEYTILMPDEILTNQENVIIGRMKLVDLKGTKGVAGFLASPGMSISVREVLGLNREAFIGRYWGSSTHGENGELREIGQSVEIQLRLFINGSLMREDVEMGLLKLLIHIGAWAYSDHEWLENHQGTHREFEFVVKRGPTPEYKEKYEEATRMYEELRENYTALENDFGEFKVGHDKLKEDYAALKSDFNKLREDHDKLKEAQASVQKDYDSLKSGYGSLQSRYGDLERRYNSAIDEVGSIRGIMYASIAAAIVFWITTVYFALRKPKVK